MTEYQIGTKLYLKSETTAEMLFISIHTLRNMVRLKTAPPYIKKGNRLYFEKEAVQKLSAERKIIEIKN